MTFDIIFFYCRLLLNIAFLHHKTLLQYRHYSEDKFIHISFYLQYFHFHYCTTNTIQRKFKICSLNIFFPIRKKNEIEVFDVMEY